MKLNLQDRNLAMAVCSALDVPYPTIEALQHLTRLKRGELSSEKIRDLAGLEHASYYTTKTNRAASGEKYV